VLSTFHTEYHKHFFKFHSVAYVDYHIKYIDTLNYRTLPQTVWKFGQNSLCRRLSNFSELAATSPQELITCNSMRQLWYDCIEFFLACRSFTCCAIFSQRSSFILCSIGQYTSCQRVDDYSLQRRLHTAVGCCGRSRSPTLAAHQRILLLQPVDHCSCHRLRHSVARWRKATSGTLTWNSCGNCATRQLHPVQAVIKLVGWKTCL
jgi:hypothetical protein